MSNSSFWGIVVLFVIAAVVIANLSSQKKELRKKNELLQATLQKVSAKPSNKKNPFF